MHKYTDGELNELYNEQIGFLKSSSKSSPRAVAKRELWQSYPSIQLSLFPLTKWKVD